MTLLERLKELAVIKSFHEIDVDCVNDGLPDLLAVVEAARECRYAEKAMRFGLRSSFDGVRFALLELAEKEKRLDDALAKLEEELWK